eukprot:gene9344-11474_t
MNNNNNSNNKRKLEDIQQGTEEWFQARKKFQLTASEFSSAMGINPYKSQFQFAQEKLGFKQPFISEYAKKAMKNGRDSEPMARFYYEKIEGIKVREKGIYPYIRDTRFASSPDGLIYNKDGIEGVIEIKSPYKSVPSDQFQTIPLHYVPQIFANMEFVGAKWCDYISYVNDKGIYIARVKRDPVVWTFILSRIDLFLKDIRSIPSKNPYKQITQIHLKELLNRKDSPNKHIKFIIKGITQPKKRPIIVKK